MLCTQRPPWISDPDISDNSPVFPSILIINSLGVGEEPNHTTARKPLILYKSFNTLWRQVFGTSPPYFVLGAFALEPNFRQGLNN
jgi:hypothetical protein